MIRKIGYTDSYGGLISAVEARELSEKGKQDSKLRRLDEISGKIKAAAAKGHNTLHLDLTVEEIKIMTSLGYEHNDIDGLSVIDWSEDPASSIEDTHHSQSSEKLDPKNKELSSSCEINESDEISLYSGGHFQIV